MLLGDKTVEIRPMEDPINRSLFRGNYPAFDRRAIHKNGVYVTNFLSDLTAKRLIEGDNSTGFKFYKIAEDFNENENQRSEAMLSIDNALYYEDGDRLYIAFYIPKKD